MILAQNSLKPLNCHSSPTTSMAIPLSRRRVLKVWTKSLDDPCPHQICRWSVSDHDGYKSLDDHDGYKSLDDHDGYKSLDDHDGYKSLDDRDGYKSLDDRDGYKSLDDHDGYKSLDDHDGSKIFEGCGQFEPDKSNLGDYQTNVDGISGETSIREDNSGEIYSQTGQEVVQNHQCQKKNEVKSVLESAVTTATVKTLGRIPKNCTKKGKHGRNIKDNIIRKIKVHYIKYIIKSLNKCIKNKKFKFLLINSSISELLTRSFNIRLFKMTIRKILYKTNISFNYKGHGKTLQVNRDVINYIYEHKEDEMEAYNILKKKYLNKRLFRAFAKYYKEELKKSIEQKMSEEEREEEKNYCKMVIKYLKIGEFNGFFTKN